MIRLTIPSLDEEDFDAVRKTLASGFLIQGPRVAEFERVVAELVGVPHAVAVSNGTCALQLALACLDVGHDDICIVPAYSWIATANVVELCGARPVFVDIDSRTFNIDAAALERTLDQLMTDPKTSGRVKAVVPVHAFGQMADMTAIASVCQRWAIPVIEDAACALGASLSGVQAGSHSALGCFSFHPRKAITTGEGGMVTTADASYARKLRALRNHGVDPDSAVTDFVMPGYNFRLTEFQGTLGITQMSKLSRIIEKRAAAARNYDQMLGSTSLTSPFVAEHALHVYQSYVALLPSEVKHSPAEIIKAARENGVELQIGTIHMPLTTFFRGRYDHREGEFPVTDMVASRALSLPLFETITSEEQQRVVDTVMELAA